MLLVLYLVQYLAIVVTYQAKASDTARATHHTEPRKMNIEHSLISTALLALQQQGELRYTGKLGDIIPHSGFYKSVLYLDSDKLGKFNILVYMTSKSPTGFGVRVTATAEVPELLLTDRHLESFEDFENEIDRDYSIAATKASRRRQLGK